MTSPESEHEPTRAKPAAPAPPWSVARVAGLLSALLAGFSLLWVRGALLLDGAGNALYVRLARDYLLDNGRVPYWLPDMWAGTPVWALGPSFPLFLLVPLSTVTSADVAVKIAILGLQVAGGIGTYVLARSLWASRTAPVVSAVVYTLHPMVVSHGALLGAEAVLGVTAALPWLAWSLRRGLRGDGRRYVVLSGALAAFAVLHQAEYALALVPLCLGMFLVEAQAARPGGWTAVRPVVARMGGVAAVALGLAAHWLVPFMAYSKNFVLTPGELVEGELTRGLAKAVGQEIGVFLNRPSSLTGAVSFNRIGVFAESFYLGWVCLALTAVTVVLLARRRGHAHLGAILLASAFVVWLSTGPVPLAASGPAQRGQLLPLAAAGAVAGLLLGSFVRRVTARRARLVAVTGAAALVVAMPFVTPFLTLQTFVPLLEQFRFPRFYMLAVLGLSLGCGFPLAELEHRMRAEGGPRARTVPAAAAVVVVFAFLVDVFPVSSHYRLHPPRGDRVAYAAVSDALAATATTGRVATSTVDPRSVASVLQEGAFSSVGWPHPAAAQQLWRVTNETYAGPEGYREAALGLSATAYVSAERITGAGGPDERMVDVELQRNPRILPLVRTYEQAVVVQDAPLAPLLATSLAYRNVGVVTAKGDAPDLGSMPSAKVGAGACTSSATGADRPPPIIVGEVALACAVDTWIGRLFAGTELLDVDRGGSGASFVSKADGLRGVAVWLAGSAGDAELALYEMDASGSSLGTELARSRAVGLDEYGMTVFSFDPISGSTGRHYGFLVTCDGCPAESRPRVISGVAKGSTGNVLQADRRVADRVAAFTPLNDRLTPATAPATKVSAQRPGPGRWTVTAEGPNPSVLVVAEAWFPGWKARVDGRSVPVFQADGAFVGLALPPGRHEVTLSFHRPASAVVGRLVTFLTLLVLGAGWWQDRGQRWRRRDRRPVPRPSAPAPDDLDVGPEAVEEPG